MTDTSAENVEQMAAYIQGGDLMTDDQLDEAAATLRALVAERDAAVEKARFAALSDSAIDAIRALLGADGKIAFIDDAVAAALLRRETERDAAQRRLAAVFRAWAILHNTLNCIIHEEDNDPPDVANAIRIARNGLDEAGREMDAADMLAARSAALAEAPR